MNVPSNHNKPSIVPGDDALIESFLRQPGGRKYLENITLILINTLPHTYSEKEELYTGFVHILNGMEQVFRRNEGEQLLQTVFREG